MINIGVANKDDDHYRYKRPKLVVKIESSGNGVKTKIVNIDEVSVSLYRQSDVLVKYFSYSLGTIAEKNDTLKGHHTYEILNNLLETFIEKYVQCVLCKIPETDFLFDSKKKLKSKCKACGYIHTFVDQSKIVEYIFKKGSMSSKK
jgi:translation initiation factor 5